MTTMAKQAKERWTLEPYREWSERAGRYRLNLDFAFRRDGVLVGRLYCSRYRARQIVAALNKALPGKEQP